MSQKVLLQERRNAVLLLTLNRPEKLNALNLALAETLVAALDAAEADDAIGVVDLPLADGLAFVKADKKIRS